MNKRMEKNTARRSILRDGQASIVKNRGRARARKGIGSRAVFVDGNFDIPVYREERHAYHRRACAFVSRIESLVDFDPPSDPERSLTAKRRRARFHCRAVGGIDKGLHPAAIVPELGN